MTALVAAFVLLGVNGFFVLAEFALVRIRKTRLEELAQRGDNRASLALKMLGRMDSYLSAVQLGVTLASLGLGWLGEPAVAAYIEPFVFQYFPGSTIVLRSVSLLLSFFVVTFVTVVLGELIPKNVAMQKTEAVLLWSVWPLYVFHKLGWPIIALFDRSARILLNLMGIEPARDIDMAHSEDELRMIVSASRRGGVLDQMESELIDNVFDFADRMAREVMIPRRDMVCLFVDDPFEDNLRVVMGTAHTRYPLCKEDKDHVLGMVHIRDLMSYNGTRHENPELTSVMREVLMVPEGMSVAKLLQLMRHKRIHLAVVVDEYGGTAGLVALEDVIEEIVGNIQDEHDKPMEPEIQRMPDGSFQFDGGVLLDDVLKLLNIRLDEHEEDTVGGYIFGLLGRQPTKGDQVEIGEYQFKVLKTDGFRILRVLACPSAEPTEPPDINYGSALS
ncbi:MAG: hemolysin family protein [Negativicutes bacterium]